MADFAFEWVKAAPKRKKGLKGQDKVGAVLHEFKHGTLHSSSGKKVTDRQQAIAIAMSEAGLSKAQVRVKPHMTKTKRGKIVPVVGYVAERVKTAGIVAEPQESYGQPKVAMTIAQQMGGIGRLKTMTGASNFIDHGNALSFEFPTNKGKPNYVKITLGQDDTYSMEFGRKRPTSVSAMAKLPDNATAEDFKNLVYTKLYEASGVYFDDLQDIFEKRTGLYLHL
jgi:hypothetical protein